MNIAGFLRRVRANARRVSLTVSMTIRAWEIERHFSESHPPQISEWSARSADRKKHIEKGRAKRAAVVILVLVSLCSKVNRKMK